MDLAKIQAIRTSSAEALLNCRTPHKLTKKWSELLQINHSKFLNLLWFSENEIMKMIKDQNVLAAFLLELPQMKISHADESAIYEQYRMLASNRISDFIKAYPYFYKERNDLEQDCYFVFKRCLYQFDHDRKIMFSTYFVTSLIYYFRSHRRSKKKSVRYMNINKRVWGIVENKCFIAFDEGLDPLCVDSVIKTAHLTEKERIVVENYTQNEGGWLTRANDELELKLGPKRYSKQGLHNILIGARVKILRALRFHSELHHEIFSLPTTD